MTYRLLVTAFVAALVGACPAIAAPATVQLRVEGSASTIFEGPVTTDGKTIDKGGGPHPCDGTTRTTPPLNPGPGPTMTSALDDAALAGGFSWQATWFDFGDFLVTSIGPPSESSGPGFWGTVLNYQPTPVGGCQQQVAAGDEALFAYGDVYAQPLLRLDGTSTVAAGQPATLTVTDGKDASPVPGALVGGSTTGADGRAAVSFDVPGVKRVKAEKTGAIRSNAHLICVAQLDGSGCEARPRLGVRGGPAPRALDRRAPRATITAPRDGARAARGPRILRGTATDDDSGVAVVKLALRRRVRGRSCQWWSGRRERFVGTHCRKAFFFAIGSDARWSYLLPRALPRGRYVLDVKAFDRQRNRDERFRRGDNRVVFEVVGRRARAERARRSRAAPRVEVMVAGEERLLANARAVRARAATVRGSGKRCLVPAASPLAALAARLSRSGPAYRVRDYGSCSARSVSSSGQLFVESIGADRNRGGDGWFYKVNHRAPTIGAADPAARRLRSSDRVLWFYCRFDPSAASCQRSLELVTQTTRVPLGATLGVLVRGYDNERRARPMAGATVTLGAASALTDAAGRTQLPASRAGHYALRAERAGAVPAFPVEIRVTASGA